MLFDDAEGENQTSSDGKTAVLDLNKLQKEFNTILKYSENFKANTTEQPTHKVS